LFPLPASPSTSESPFLVDVGQAVRREPTGRSTGRG
jgi:hypothetical protein